MGRAEALQKVQVGTYGEEGDQLDWTYYDEAILAAATTTWRLFTTPLGSGGKRLDQTNMPLAGQIPQGQLLDVRAIKIMYATATGAHKATLDVNWFYQMIKNTTLAIKLQNKENMGQWLLQELIGAATLFALTPTAAGDNIPLIQPRYHCIFPLNKKIVLAALTPFEVTVVHHVAVNATLAGDSLKVGLAGILTRVT